MEKFTQVTGAAIALDIDNLDTDQIMPKQFLRGIDKKGLDKGTLYNLRFHADGTPDMDSVFNKPGFDKAPVIVGGPNFGCGSSREHAVWGLQQIGVKAVVAPSFGEIFYSNCFNNGLLAARVSPEDSRKLFAAISSDTPTEVTVDLNDCTIRVLAAGLCVPFTIASRHRTMLLEGLDMLESTMKGIDAINAFRARHEAAFPWMSGLAGKTARILKSREKA